MDTYCLFVTNSFKNFDKIRCTPTLPSHTLRRWIHWGTIYKAYAVYKPLLRTGWWQHIPPNIGNDLRGYMTSRPTRSQCQIHQLEKLQHLILQKHWFIWNSQTHWPTYSWHVGYTIVASRSHRTLEWSCRVAIIGVMITMMMMITAIASGWKACILLTGQTCKMVHRSRWIKKILGAEEELKSPYGK